MTQHRSFLRTCLRWMQKVFVRSTLIPNDPIASLPIDKAFPIAYVLRSESLHDLIVLEKKSLELGLPSPFEALNIGSETLSRYVWVESKGQGSEIGPFQRLLDIHTEQPDLNVQLIPVSLLWGRNPKEGKPGLFSSLLTRLSPQAFTKFLQVLFLGRRCYVQFSQPMSLGYMANEYGTDRQIAHKLSRVARVHFHRLHRAMVGPILPERHSTIHSLMQSPSIANAIQEEITAKGVSRSEAEKNAYKYLNEIAANYKDMMIIFANHVLNWVWGKVYKGIQIHGIERVRKYAKDGHSIVYVPCHRSHMDYLLLSHLLYAEGMLPPHIAAGINLNFWPAGPMFRMGGAFFMRRSFSGNKFYASVFKAYLDHLFNKGYSVEFFTEGGRSRTGRLLQPKTGMLAMTMRSLLRGLNRPITLVPVYLGYDHVMEVGTYHKELAGQKKKQESLLHVFSILNKLKNNGYCSVSFGEPITLHQYLNHKVPNWRDVSHAADKPKESWLVPCVNDLAHEVMVRINRAASVTAVSLTSLVLLSKQTYSLERQTLVKQLDLYLKVLRDLPIHDDVVAPSGLGTSLLEQVIELNKVEVIKDDFGDMIGLNSAQAISMTYYRNNILHLLICPALLVMLVEQHQSLSRKALLKKAQLFMELLQAELFLEFDDLQAYLTKLIDYLVVEGLFLKKSQLSINPEFKVQATIFSGMISESVQRYAILFQVLYTFPEIDRGTLAEKCHMLALRLGKLNGTHAPEFFDKKLYGQLYLFFQRRFSGNQFESQIKVFHEEIQPLLPVTIKQTLDNITIF